MSESGFKDCCFIFFIIKQYVGESYGLNVVCSQQNSYKCLVLQSRAIEVVLSGICGHEKSTFMNGLKFISNDLG
jgi:hypothetical protein